MLRLKKNYDCTIMMTKMCIGGTISKIVFVTSTNSAKTVNDMKQYRKKPVTIEAVQFDGLNPTEIKDFVGENCEVEIYDNDVTPPVARIVIHTLEGDMEVSKGDYVIKGVKGEFYPCKPGIFQQTYESAETQKELEEEMKRFIDAHYHTRFDETLENGNDPLTVFDFEDIAHHFAEWGAKNIK